VFSLRSVADAKQHSIETTAASIAQLVVQLTCNQVAGLNPAVEQIFFEN